MIPKAYIDIFTNLFDALLRPIVDYVWLVKLEYLNKLIFIMNFLKQQ